LAQLRREDVVVDTTLLTTDQQRSVLNVLDANRLHPLAYTPYGHRPAESDSLSLLGFNGERPDPVTGHYLLGNGYRVFNPVLMRFNSPDSLSPFGEGGINAYAYCAGDPVNWIDPTGNTPITPTMDKFLKNLAKQAFQPPKITKQKYTRLAWSRKNYASLKERATRIQKNEKQWTDHNHGRYTLNNDLPPLKESRIAYDAARQKFNFDKIPDPNIEYKLPGTTTLDTSHFDATINYFKKSMNPAQVKQYNNQNQIAPITHGNYPRVYQAIALRAAYIYKFTNIDLRQPPPADLQSAIRQQ
jgi:RHS repeat-associated protein